MSLFAKRLAQPEGAQQGATRRPTLRFGPTRAPFFVFAPRNALGQHFTTLRSRSAGFLTYRLMTRSC
jgi:hypothetical protein